VTVVEVAPPVREVEPFCTLMSALAAYSTTCHQMVWVPVVWLSGRNCRLLVLVSSPTRVSLKSHAWASDVGFLDHVTNAWLTAATGEMATLTVAPTWAVSPRWTLTPQMYSTTYHWMVMVAGVASSVLRANSRVVASAMRPRTTEPTGRLLLLRRLNSR
jgi:hypothetical protein